MSTDSLKKIWKDAETYAAKYGRAEPHLKTVGRLHKVDVATQICHQEHPSDQNYWTDTNFDCALEEVIKKRFPELAAEALAILQKRYETALCSEKEQLLARLAAIEAIEQGA